MIDFNNLHVGLTNRCRLSCPECARTIPGGRYVQKMFDLDVEYFKKFLLDCHPRLILFCGNWGDPIYSKDFIGLVDAIKKSNPDCCLLIHTNGSGKSTEWWTKLTETLHDNDMLVFSIDGTPENYTKYRINSEWADVENAIKTVIATKKRLNKKTSIQWKHLVFSYNENTIMDSYKISVEMGFDKFFLQHGLVYAEPWLATSKPFREIENNFYEQKNKSLL